MFTHHHGKEPAGPARGRQWLLCRICGRLNRGAAGSGSGEIWDTHVSRISCWKWRISGVEVQHISDGLMMVAGGKGWTGACPGHREPAQSQARCSFCAIHAEIGHIAATTNSMFSGLVPSAVRPVTPTAPITMAPEFTTLLAATVRAV